jgi:hypothetical protein
MCMFACINICMFVCVYLCVYVCAYMGAGMFRMCVRVSVCGKEDIVRLCLFIYI